MKKICLSGVLALILVLVLLVISCDNTGNTTDDEIDGWKNVTDISQLYGTWENDGPVSYTNTVSTRVHTVNYTYSSLTINETIFSETSSVTFKYLLETQEYKNCKTTYDFDNKTCTISGSFTSTSSGMTEEDWQFNKDLFEKYYGELAPNFVTIIFNDSKYSYTVTYNNYQDETNFLGIDDISDMIDIKDFQINQKGTKIKIKLLPGIDNAIMILVKVK